MQAMSLLATLQGRGFKLVADGERLIVAPASALTDDLRMVIREHKPELLQLIKSQDCPECGGNLKLHDQARNIWWCSCCQLWVILGRVQ